MIKDLQELIVDGTPLPSGWGCKAIIWDDNFCYLAWNEKTRDAILVDSCRDDGEAMGTCLASMPALRIAAIIDTHTHADHVSAGALWSEKLHAPWIMHSASLTHRAQIRVFSDAAWPTQAGPIRFITTPGHSPDSLTIHWGPYLFTADTILYGDSGRDDLPGGDPIAHYESLQKLKTLALPLETLVLPGHDGERGRISSWKTQLAVNPSLQQSRSDFVREASAYTAPAPKNFKEALFENQK